MDITIIKGELTNQETGIPIGQRNAPHHSREFLNLACPYCKKWFLASSDLLNEKTNSGQLLRTIKLLDKDKESLRKGNFLHDYVPKTDSQKTIAAITDIFVTQKEWQELSLPELKDFAENHLGLSLSADHEMKEAVKKEAKAANIQFVPTIWLDGHLFDESIELETLEEYLG